MHQKHTAQLENNTHTYIHSHIHTQKAGKFVMKKKIMRCCVCVCVCVCVCYFGNINFLGTRICPENELCV